MRIVQSLVACLLLGLAHPGEAIVRTWRAEGTVNSLQGTVSLLPLAAQPGDAMLLEFSYDDAAPDQEADPSNGRFAVVSAVVTIGGETLDFLGTVPLLNRVATQIGGSADRWDLSVCRADCGADDADEARLHFELPPGSRASDALLPQPLPEDATAPAQFLLRSTNASEGTEAFAVGELDALVYVPEPGAPLTLAAGALALLGARLTGRSRGSSARRSTCASR